VHPNRWGTVGPAHYVFLLAFQDSGSPLLKTAFNTRKNALPLGFYQEYKFRKRASVSARPEAKTTPGCAAL
jgi:hypothetical protein